MDQELAKVLAGVSQDADTSESVLNFEETPVIVNSAAPTPAPAVADPTPVVTDTPADDTPVVEEPLAAVIDTPGPVGIAGDLADIKKDALNELRPLVDKLTLEPDEKFDTYLLLLRSTDDKSLIAPAYAAAQAIPDETRRAQALLDIIKEIDYLSAPQA
jgi:hypothetical protein